MTVELIADPDAFATLAEPFLTARIERNVLATVLHVVRARGGYGSVPPRFAVDREAGSGRVRAAALRTPPHPMLAAGFETREAAGALMRAWLREDPQPGGVSGEPGTARAIAAAYCALAGGTSERSFAEAMFALTEVVDPPRPAPGALRPAGDRDRPTLVAWELAFGQETGLLLSGQPEAAVDRRLGDGFQYLWIDPAGTAVTTVAHNLPVAGTVRIGPVYTPPEHRGHGYASAATAALSRRLLDAGAERCMLFTDLANPTSNKIYASIGYERFADWEEHRLLPPGAEVGH